jgi:hypothetical protein
MTPTDEIFILIIVMSCLFFTVGGWFYFYLDDRLNKIEELIKKNTKNHSE